jgi:hypothetical protein
MKNIPVTIENAEDFFKGSWDYVEQKHQALFIRPYNPDIGGGRITCEEIDVFENYPDIDTLSIKGLTQPTFEYFIKKYGHRIKAIRFFKNKLVEDWSLLAGLKNLEFVSYFHNQRITQLWDMSGNTALKGLHISDFSRLKTVKGIEKAPSLEIFSIGDAVWPKAEIDSFAPLANTKIKWLDFGGKSIKDNDVSFVKDMPCLERFDFPSNLFTTEQIAWIVANRPDVQGCCFQPAEEYIDDFDNTSRTIIIGKRKPVLKTAVHKQRIERYVQEFYALVEKYKGVPYSVAFPKQPL